MKSSENPMTLYELIRASKQITMRDELDTISALDRAHLLRGDDAQRLSSVLALMRRLADKLPDSN
jgi:hypothetical protein